MIGISLFLLFFGTILFLIFLLKRHHPKEFSLTSGTAWSIVRFFLAYWLVAFVYGCLYLFAYEADKNCFLINAEIRQTRMKSLYDVGLERLLRSAREAKAGVITTDTVELAMRQGDTLAGVFTVRLGSESIVTSDRRKIAPFVRQYHSKYRTETLTHFRKHPHQVLELDFGSSKFLLPDSNAAHRFHDSVLATELARLQTKMRKLTTFDPTEFSRNTPTRTVINNTLHTLNLIIGVDTLHISDTIAIPGLVPTYLNLAERNDFLQTWNLLDFTYFSTQTITGGGYGDIIPNSTFVRIAVITETFLGYFIILAILNVVIVSVSRQDVSFERRKRFRFIIRKKTTRRVGRLFSRQSDSFQRRGWLRRFIQKTLGLSRGT